MDKSILMIASNQTLSEFDMNQQIEEIKNLSAACEIETLDVLIQNIKTTSNAFYIGKGKVAELKEIVDAQEANIVVFNVGLSPSQIRNIEEILEVDVIDKNMLILEIFKRRAQTPESKAQVEIANLKYMFPRMRGSYEELGRQVSGFGNRNRGLGETKLELDRRSVEKQIQKLEKELDKYKRVRDTQRKQKLSQAVPLVALVGYTNAGKSSLMNVFQDKKVFVKDMLFASLETYARSVKIEPHYNFILHDTVGFIQDLPHNLINAFHSTLEEIEDADLIIHVIDRANINYEKQKEAVEATLNTLNISDIPIINVYNKVDLLDTMPENGHDSLFISTVDLYGIEALKNRIIEILWKDFGYYTLKIPYAKMNLVQEVRNHMLVVDEYSEDTGMVLSVFVENAKLNPYREYIV